MKTESEMVKWMAERIYEDLNKLEGEKRKNFLKIVKNGEKYFFERCIINVGDLAMHYCLVTGSPVIVGNISEISIQIFESIKELFKNEMNTIEDELTNTRNESTHILDTKEKSVSNSSWFSKFNLFKLLNISK
jgi:hypothetical protein